MGGKGSPGTTVGPVSLTTTAAGDLVYAAADAISDTTVSPATPWTDIVGATQPGGETLTTKVTYSRDAANRIVDYQVAQDGTAVSNIQYGYSGISNAPAWSTTVGSGQTQALEDLPGGVTATYTTVSGNGTWSWEYSDLHGDDIASAFANGVKTEATGYYDPFGDAITPLQGAGTGNTAYGYEGRHEIADDTDTPLSVLQMGARVYDPATGRFLSIDPVVGGSANNYDYADQEPIANSDPDGNCTWGCVLMNTLKSAGRVIKKAGTVISRHVGLSFGFCQGACLSISYFHGHLGLNAGCCGAGLRALSAQVYKTDTPGRTSVSTYVSTPIDPALNFGGGMAGHDPFFSFGLGDQWAFGPSHEFFDWQIGRHRPTFG